MKKYFLLFFIFTSLLLSCSSSKKTTNNTTVSEISSEKSFITNKTPYDPRPGMKKLEQENVIVKPNGEIKLKEPIHFLVFGDSKGSKKMQEVLKIADEQHPQFCITTADLVNKGADSIGIINYRKLDSASGWFFRKYPT